MEVQTPYAHMPNNGQQMGCSRNENFNEIPKLVWWHRQRPYHPQGVTSFQPKDKFKHLHSCEKDWRKKLIDVKGEMVKSLYCHS